MTHRFLHLSDIHFGQEKNGTRVTHDHIRNVLMADVKVMTAKRGPASRILITGDIAYSGKAEEYKTATQWIEKLTATCGCQETDVSTIPGNHDCDLKAISNQAKMLCAQLRVSAPDLAKAMLHGINQDGEADNPFLPKLKAYREFANGYGCDFESASRPLWKRDFALPDGIKLCFFGLTSVQISDLEDARGKMILGNEQFTIAEEDNIINVLLVHHPLDWFLDEQEASQYVKNNFRVIMVGHEHALNIEKTVDAFTNKELLGIFAGATNPPNDGGNYSYAYNWLEFSLDHTNGNHKLVVEIFPRVWVQENVRFEADRRRLGTADESARVEILCQNLKPAVGQNEAHGVIDTVSPELLLPADSPDIFQSVERPNTMQGGISMTDNRPGFDRLRYLFWQYLDWQQRLKVLVDADALPKTANQPVPQTLERLALENAAKNTGKLRDMWDAIMPLVPDQKRGPNPF